MPVLIEALLRFAGLLAAIYTVTVAVYFALGSGISWMNDRNPERRIQKSRRGEIRKQAEIRQSMISMLVTCASLSFGLTMQWQGWAPTPFAFSWLWAVPLFILCMVLFDLWFYAAHRLLHTKAFYKYHALHHKSVAPTVWSSDSIGAVDTAMCQGFYAVIVFIVPFPPAILLAHRLFDQINGTFGHAGFEYFASRTARYPSPMLCTIYHDQHHSQFRYNYANYFSFWDRVFGTVAPSYDGKVKSFEGEQPPLKFKRGAVQQPGE